ncbi:MAG: hypothetical protein HYV09_26555 [Deltaproteobacteria bacterium]|nr:hypothetical protein [Deltaproteobacteria bacterium]
MTTRYVTVMETEVGATPVRRLSVAVETYPEGDTAWIAVRQQRLDDGRTFAISIPVAMVEQMVAAIRSAERVARRRGRGR